MQPEALWFIDNIARVHVGGRGSALVEVSARDGDMPPLHVHHRDDETFFVLDGRLTLFQPEGTVTLDAGSAYRAERGIPHTYRVESKNARWLVFTEPAGFEQFVLDVSARAEFDGYPPDDRPKDPDALAAAAARRGIELLGPPGALP